MLQFFSMAVISAVIFTCPISFIKSERRYVHAINCFIERSGFGNGLEIEVDMG